MAGPIHPRLLTRAKATRGFLIASVAVGLATAGLLIGQAWFLAEAITTVATTLRVPENLVQIVALLIGIFLARAILVWLNSWLAQRSSAQVKSQLRQEIMAARLSRPVATDSSSASLVNLVTKGLDDLDGYYSKYLPQLGLAVTVPFLVGGAVLLADWQSAIIIAFTLPLIPLFMALIGWTTRTATAKNFALADRLANHFGDLIMGLPTLQAFARARAQRKGIELTEERYRGATMKVLYISFLSAFALELLATLSVAVVAVTIGFRLVYDQVSFETALFVLILAPEAFLPVRQVGAHFHDSADGVAAADAAFNLIDEAATPDGAAAPPDLATHRISLDSVDFSYGENQILTGFDLTLAPAELVVMEGTSGVGKTTVLNLLLGYLAPDSGKVMVGDVQLSDIDHEAWLRQVAYVPQDPGMVNGTVADNLLLGFPGATADQLATALRDAGADFNADKAVGEDAEGLSAGERRRVAVARALLRIRFGDAKLLLLDEPTAGLDAKTEADVITAVRETGVTALVVSHRPAVLAAADRVVSMQPQVVGL